MQFWTSSQGALNVRVLGTYHMCAPQGMKVN